VFRKIDHAYLNAWGSPWAFWILVLIYLIVFLSALIGFVQAILGWSILRAMLAVVLTICYVEIVFLQPQIIQFEVRVESFFSACSSSAGMANGHQYMLCTQFFDYPNLYYVLSGENLAELATVISNRRAEALNFPGAASSIAMCLPLEVKILRPRQLFVHVVCE
jgi:hypothetical protein